jgi:hypothetical protein
MPRPRKIEFPVGLEEMLRLAMPRKRLEDRFKFYRMELREHFHWKHGRPPTQEEIEQEMCRARTIKFDQSVSIGIGQNLRNHLSIFESEIRRQRAKNAATKRWSKENREKSKKTH